MQIRWLSVCAALVLVASLVFGQETKSPATTFKAQAELVLVPAVVTEHDEPVVGLKASDFTLLHNGKREPIAVFEEINAMPARFDNLALPAHTTQNYIQGDSHQDVNILLLDFLSADVWTKESIRKNLLPVAWKFADRRLPVAVVLMSYTGLVQVHSLATNPSEFVEAVEEWIGDKPEKQRSGDPAPVWGSPMAPTDASFSAAMLRKYGIQLRNAPKKGIIDAGYEYDARAMHNRALNQLVEAYRGLPGRKKLFWYGSPPNLINLPDPNFMLYPITVIVAQATTVMDACGNVHPEFEQWFRYPTPANVCDDRGDVCVQRGLADGGHYYMLGFYLRPNAAPGIHTLAVRVDRKKVMVRARDKFMLEAPAPTSVRVGKKGNQREIGLVEMLEALESDPEFASLNDVDELKNDSSVMQALASPLDYSLVPLRLQWSVITKPGGGSPGVELLVSSPPGGLTAPGDPASLSLQYVVYVRRSGASEGRYVQESLTGLMNPQEYQQFMAAGFRYHNAIELAPGNYDIRVLVRNRPTGQMGTVSAQVHVSAIPAVGALNP